MRYETGQATIIPDRLEPRHSVPREQSGYIEFDYPQKAGKRRRVSLQDVSAAGLCFVLPFYKFSGVSLSTHLTDVVVRVGGCEFEGELSISHVTRESRERILCGGRFIPTTKSDRLQMIKLVAALETLS